MQDETKRILMGRVAGLYGVKGWLKIVSYTRPPENIFLYNPWQIKQDGTGREVALVEGKVHGKGLIAAFAGITDRDAARELVGADIEIDHAQLRELAPGEYYWHDLLGMQVVNSAGKLLGRLIEILETGANDVLVVKGEGRHLIPLVWNRYVLAIDRDLGIIRVDWDIME